MMSTRSHGIVDHAGLFSGDAHQQRHRQRLLVAEDAVPRFRVFPEPLAVVAGDDDQRPVIQAAVPQPLEDPAHVEVDVGDLAVVGREGGIGFEGLGRRVREVGIVEMEPAEEGAPGRRLRSNQASKSAKTSPAVLSDLQVLDVAPVFIRSL